MIYSEVIITQKGLDLIAKLQASEQQMKLEALAVGKGTTKLTKSSTELTQEMQRFEFDKIEKAKNATVTMKATVDNINLASSYDVRELGIYATDPDDGSILYAVINTEQVEVYDHLPKYESESDFKEVIFYIQIRVANESNVSFTLSPQSLREQINRNAEDIKELQENNKTGIPPTPMRSFKAIAADKKCTIRFNEPKDTIIDGQCICAVKGSMVRMSKESYPATPEEGDLVINNTNLGAYATDGLLIENLTNEQQYYFRAFPYSDHGVYNLMPCEENKTSCTPSESEQCEVTVSANTGTLTQTTITLTNVTDGSKNQTYTLAAGSGSHIFAVAAGEQYKVSMSNVDTYLTPDETATFTAVAGGSRAVAMEYTYAPAFADCSWELVEKIVQRKMCSSVWSVGDEKTISISNTNYKIVILGFDHDTYYDGSGTAPVTFGLKNCMDTKYQMNSTSTNVGGWASTALRNTLRSTILNGIETELKTRIKNVSKKTSAGNQSTSITTSSENLFLFSEIEIFGNVTYSTAGEGTQYPYFSTTSRRVKMVGDAGSAANWWGRSPYVSNATGFCVVDDAGGVNTGSATYSYGVSFGFCI